MPASNPQALSGRVALVTGGARRVGRTVALELAAAGMDVAITYNRSASDAAELVAGILALGRRAHAIHADHAAAGAPQEIVTAFHREFDRLDVLVNNASTFAPSPFGSISRATWERDMAVNATVPFLLIQAFAPMLGAHYVPGDPASTGRVVNFIDIHVLGEALAGYLSYNASKAALMEITSTCALELAPRVTVNAIAPGVVSWPEEHSDELRREYMQRVPLARPGTPADAAAAVLYLVRDAHYCTGQVIKLDGGRSLT
ncbi:MAG: SDR family oxidoreductase [Gammaproteobacteria bacterium]|nr:SDR family oxidoreductase [Gammaproteobacteria bacterium]